MKGLIYGIVGGLGVGIIGTHALYYGLIGKRMWKISSDIDIITENVHKTSLTISSITDKIKVINVNDIISQIIGAIMIQPSVHTHTDEKEIPLSSAMCAVLGMLSRHDKSVEATQMQDLWNSILPSHSIKTD